MAVFGMAVMGNIFIAVISNVYGEMQNKALSTWQKLVDGYMRDDMWFKLNDACKHDAQRPSRGRDLRLAHRNPLRITIPDEKLQFYRAAPSTKGVSVPPVLDRLFKRMLKANDSFTGDDKAASVWSQEPCCTHDSGEEHLRLLALLREDTARGDAVVDDGAVDDGSTTDDDSTDDDSADDKSADDEPHLAEARRRG